MDGRCGYNDPLKASQNKLWKLLIDKGIKGSDLSKSCWAGKWDINENQEKRNRLYRNHAYNMRSN